MEQSSEEESIVIETRWNIPFAHHAGRTASRFFRAMRDEQKIYGVRCGQCQRVLVPARSFCEQCFVPVQDWVEVGPQGSIESFAINCMQYEGLPTPPYVIALVKLDGADTSLLHWIGDLDLSNVEMAASRIPIGTRVEAVWKAKRDGAMTDIAYFRLL
jgi:uncharacterized OB-fold protein